MPVIYKIENSATGLLYIGSAISEGQRKRRHFKDLRQNKHHSKYLQRAFNKYGIGCFSFSVIEFVVDKSNLINREQYWIDLLKPKYNLSPTAGSSLGVKHTESCIIKNSLRNSGFRNGNCKIKEEQVKDIVEKRRYMSQQDIANEYGVNRSTIQRIQYRYNIYFPKFYSEQIRKKLGTIGIKNLPNKSKTKN